MNPVAYNLGCKYTLLVGSNCAHAPDVVWETLTHQVGQILTGNLGLRITVANFIPDGVEAKGIIPVLMSGYSLFKDEPPGVRGRSMLGGAIKVGHDGTSMCPIFLYFQRLWTLATDDWTRYEILGRSLIHELLHTLVRAQHSYDKKNVMFHEPLPGAWEIRTQDYREMVKMLAG